MLELLPDSASRGRCSPTGQGKMAAAPKGGGGEGEGTCGAGLQAQVAQSFPKRYACMGDIVR